MMDTDGVYNGLNKLVRTTSTMRGLDEGWDRRGMGLRFVAYYVVGGEYADTTFRELVKPAPVSGPFDDYYSAYEAWRHRAMETIDQAYARFHIVQTVEATPVPGLGAEISNAH